MGKRRKAREIVLNALYFREMSGDCLETLIDRVGENSEVKEEVKEYARRLLEETVKNLKSIDERLSDIIKNWDFQRVALVDKCILRFASAEILFFPDIPVKVSIDEAVEIAKMYSTEHSGRFVNGILDEIARRAKLI
jgi:transcription antitermination factor NusB